MCVVGGREYFCNGNMFFFQVESAYEIMPSLVGSEMCISVSWKVLKLKEALFLSSIPIIYFQLVSYKHLTLPTKA